MPPIASLEIHGYRGFETKQRVDFAVADGANEGSGLTVVVGPNNAGKSTIYESLRMFAGRGERRFSEGRRNVKAGNRVEIRLRTTTGYEEALLTIAARGAATRWEPTASAGQLPPVFLIPSRRAFPSAFGAGSWDRGTYSQNIANILARQSSYDPFAYRLQRAQGDRGKI